MFPTDTLGAMTEVAKLAEATYKLAFENWKADEDYDGSAFELYKAAREANWKAEQMVREEKVRIEVDRKMAAWRKSNAA